MLGLKDTDFESWHNEEQHYLSSLEKEPKRDVWTVAYVEALQALEAAQAAYGQITTVQFQNYTPADLQESGSIPTMSHAQECAQEAKRRGVQNRLELAMNVVDDLEHRLGITTRWCQADKEYQDARAYISHQRWIRVVETLEGLVVQRLFAKANLSSTGYKLRKHIAKAIVRRSAAIRTALDKYNQFAPLQVPPCPQLKYTELASYALLGEFDLLKSSRARLLDKPWAIPAHREVALMYFKIVRAREELVRLNVESCRLWTWINNEEKAMEQAAAAQQTVDSRIQGALNTLLAHRRRINNVHRRKLCLLRNILGYTGSWSPGVLVGDTGKPSVIPGDEVRIEDLEEGGAVMPDEDDTLLDETLRYETFVGSLNN